MPSYIAPRISDLGSLADLTLAGSINKSGRGSDAFSALSGLGGSVVVITGS